MSFDNKPSTPETKITDPDSLKLKNQLKNNKAGLNNNTNKSDLSQTSDSTSNNNSSTNTDNTNSTSNTPYESTNNATTPAAVTETTSGDSTPPNSTPVEQNLIKNYNTTFVNTQSTDQQLEKLQTLTPFVTGDATAPEKPISSESWLANASQLQNAAYTPMLNGVNSFRDANTFDNFKSVAAGNAGGYYMNYYGTDKAVGIVSSYSTDVNNLYSGHNALTGDLTFSSMAHNNMISVTDTNGSSLGSLLYNNQFPQPKVALQCLDAGANNIMATTAGQTALEQQLLSLHDTHFY